MFAYFFLEVTFKNVWIINGIRTHSRNNKGSLIVTSGLRWKGPTKWKLSSPSQCTPQLQVVHQYRQHHRIPRKGLLLWIHLLPRYIYLGLFLELRMVLQHEELPDFGRYWSLSFWRLATNLNSARKQLILQQYRWKQLWIRDFLNTFLLRICFRFVWIKLILEM